MNHRAIRSDGVDRANVGQIANGSLQLTSKSVVVLRRSVFLLEEELELAENELSRLEGAQGLLSGQARNQLCLGFSVVEGVAPALPDQGG